MNIAGQNTKARLLDVAEELALQRGFWSTSFADICERAGMNRGNFYYHFHTKKELLEAVIDRKLEMVAGILAEIEDKTPDPRKRALLYVDNLKDRSDVYVKYGCPIGGLAVELAKHSPEHLKILGKAFDRAIDWLEKQLRQFSADSRKNAYHIHQVFQGAIVQAAAMRSDKPLKLARKNLHGWINSL